MVPTSPPPKHETSCLTSCIRSRRASVIFPLLALVHSFGHYLTFTRTRWFHHLQLFIWSLFDLYPNEMVPPFAVDPRCFPVQGPSPNPSLYRNWRKVRGSRNSITRKMLFDHKISHFSSVFYTARGFWLLQGVLDALGKRDRQLEKSKFLVTESWCC